MKTRNVSVDHDYAIERGWVGSDGAASTGLISVGDGNDEVGPTARLTFSGSEVRDGDGTTIVVTKWKIPCRVATTTAGTLASSFENGDTVDGVVLATGDRILVKDQSSGSENGIYVVQDSGAPSRASDFDDDFEALGTCVYVYDGTANAGTIFVCLNTTEPTLNTDAIVFGSVSGGTGSASDGLPGLDGMPGINGRDGLPGIDGLDGMRGPIGALAEQDHGTVGASENIDCSTKDIHRLVLGANCTLSVSGTAASPVPTVIRVRLIQDSTGSRTVTWWAGITWKAGVAPTLSTAANAVDAFGLEYDSINAVWYGVVVGTVTGPQGIQGEVGMDGLPGAQGVQGIQGLPGNDGIDGLQGAIGATGATGAAGSGAELDYVEKTTATNVTATVEASSDVIVTANLVNYSGSQKIVISVFCGELEASATAARWIALYLFDNGSSIGELVLHRTPASNVNEVPAYAERRLTPASGNHTYSLRGLVSSGTGVVSGGTGGVGTAPPTFIRQVAV